MADLNQKLKGVEDGIKRMELQLQSFVADNKQRLDKLETEHNQLTSMFHSIMDAPYKSPKLKLKFPEFDLENIRFWIRRCNSCFELCQIPEHLKMAYVSLNIKGKAEYWYECYVSDQGESAITWEKFCVDICQRFGVEPMEVVHKLKSIEQSGDMDVEQYLEKFEAAMSAMVSAYPSLQETFYVSWFIAGLKPDIKPIVVMKSPTTLIGAFQVAKLQEKYLTALYKLAEVEEDEKKD